MLMLILRWSIYALLLSLYCKLRHSICFGISTAASYSTSLSEPHSIDLDKGTTMLDTESLAELHVSMAPTASIFVRLTMGIICEGVI